MLTPNDIKLRRMVASAAWWAGYAAVPAWLIVAQARLESGNYTSAVFLENKNYFGLKQPVHRPTTAIGSNRGHAVYASHADCVLDYFLRAAYFDIPNTRDPDEFIQATVASGYATAQHYGTAWHNVYANLLLDVKEHRGPLVPVFLFTLGLLTFGQWTRP